jgi:hypothetical protein
LAGARGYAGAGAAWDGHLKGFKADAAHDAHHRGQITMLARQLGYPVPQSVMVGLWEWGTHS